MVKKALLIGINYTGTSSQLNGCINDVYNVRDFLVNYCGYVSSNIRILSDKDLLPTGKNIKDNMSWLVSGSLPGDSLFFHYSGHGAYVLDKNNDETDGRDETIIPLDYATAGMITDDWIFDNFLSKVPRGVSLWALMDCCHSGTVFDLKYNYKSRCKLKSGKVLSRVYNSVDWTNEFAFSFERSKELQGGNVYMLSGALDPQYAADAFIAGQAQGAFTSCFMACMKNNLVTENNVLRFKPGTLKMRDILKEINARLLAGGFKTQNSQLSGYRLNVMEVSFDP